MAAYVKYQLGIEKMLDSVAAQPDYNDDLDALALFIALTK